MTPVMAYALVLEQQLTPVQKEKAIKLVRHYGWPVGSKVPDWLWIEVFEEVLNGTG